MTTVTLCGRQAAVRGLIGMRGPAGRSFVTAVSRRAADQMHVPLPGRVPVMAQVGLQHVRFYASTKDTDTKLVKNLQKTAVDASGNASAVPAAKPTIWQKVKKEAKHYWDGTKLLGYEIRVSWKLALKMASGRELTRREDRQLKRTVQDMIRLVPFSMFVLVPFAELLLPVALSIFPNMLPSTYESAKGKEAKSKKLGSTRTKVGEYLRDTVGNSASVRFPKARTEEQKKDFEEFFKQVRDGERPEKALLLRVAQLFRDDKILDNMSRPQLAAMARYINLHPFGTATVLRYSIRHRMRQIKQDDYTIEREGVDSLNTLELQNACQSRGFKTLGVSTGRLREDLSNWLQLRLKDKVPSTLLVLSSAYTYGGHDLDSFYDGVSAVLSALPNEVYHETELDVSHDQATNEQRLEVLKEQEELIKEENKEEADSGHIIQVRDHLNVDEETPENTDEARTIGDHEPGTTAEEDVKADQSPIDPLGKLDKPARKESEAQETHAEEDVRADESPIDPLGKLNRHGHTTASEDSAKADQSDEDPLGKLSKSSSTSSSSVDPEATHAEEDVKADDSPVDPLGKLNRHGHTTASEDSAKADQSSEDPLGKLSKSSSTSSSSVDPEATHAEEDVKADDSPVDPLGKLNRHGHTTASEDSAKADQSSEDPLGKLTKNDPSFPDETSSEADVKADDALADPLHKQVKEPRHETEAEETTSEEDVKADDSSVDPLGKLVKPPRHETEAEETTSEEDVKADNSKIDPLAKIPKDERV